MKIEATVKQIRALLQLAELNEDADTLSPAAGQRGLPLLVLERYHALINAGRTPVVVPIERGACSGCHIRLPTMLEHQAGRSPALYTCPHCRRLLYAPELVRECSHADDGGSRRAASESAGRRS